MATVTGTSIAASKWQMRASWGEEVGIFHWKLWGTRGLVVLSPRSSHEPR